MTGNLTGLMRLKRSHIGQASETLARAFQDEPVYAYFVPDASARRKVLRYHFAMRLRCALSGGEVCATSPGLEGVCMWLPPGQSRIGFGAFLFGGGLSVLFHMGWTSVSRQRSTNEYLQLEHARNAPFPHWYLSSLAVDPMYQWKGYASRLLKPMLARLDRDHLPCYLDTQRETNVSLYQHFGFAVLKESIIPGTSIKTRAMMRRP